MPEQDLATLVRSLTPGALRLFKQQLASLPERDRQTAFSRLSGIPELEEIIGRPTPAQKPTRKEPEAQQVQQEVPLWAKGLQTVGAPFEWISKRITEPFGAVVTAPFTPGLPGGRQLGESPLAYARRQYEQWEEPTWTMPWGGKFRPTKGIVETLPWFALPTAGGIVGKLGGLAAKGGALGKAAGYGAAALKPVAVAEQVLNPFAWQRGIGSFAAKRAGGGKLVPKEVTPEVTKLARISEKLESGGKLTPEEKQIWLANPQAVSDAGIAVRRAERARVTPSGVPLTKTVWRAETGLPTSRVSKSYALVKEVAEPEFTVGKPKPEFKVVKSEITLQRPLVIKGLQGDLLDIWAKEGDIEATRLLSIAGGAAKTRTAFQEVMGIGKTPPGWYVEADNYIAKKAGSLGYDGVYYDAGQRAEIVAINKELVGEVGAELGEIIPKKVVAKPLTMFSGIASLKEKLTKLGRTVTTGEDWAPTLDIAVERWYRHPGDAEIELLGKVASASPEYRKAILDILMARYPTGYIKVFRGVSGEGRRWGISKDFVNATSDRKVAKEFSEGEKILEATIKVDDVVAIASVGESELILRPDVLRSRIAGAGVGRIIPEAEAVPGAVTPGLGKIIPEGGIPPIKPPVVTKVASEMFPAGLPEPQATATKWLTDLTRKSKPITKETLELRKPEHAFRSAEYERILKEEITKGVSVKEAEIRATRALEDPYSKAPLTPAFLEQLKEQGKYEATLLRMIADANFKYGFERKNAFAAFWRLLNEGHLQMNQIQILERVFGSELAKALLEKHRTLGQKIWFNVIDAINIPRGLLSMADLSGFGRQGWILTTTRPGEAIKAVMPMIESMFSEKNAMFLDDVFLNRKHIDKVLRLRPDFLTKWAGEATDIVAREEGFASRWLNKFPVVGQIYKGSTRAYTTVLNDLRTANVSAAISGWEKNGFKYLDLDEAAKLYGNNAKAIFDAKFYTDVDIDMIARTVSWASGRGSLPKELAHYAGAANAVLFAPKLIASRLEFPFAVLPGVNPSRLARREAARELLSFIGTGGGILGMAVLSDQGSVELDPRSPDFGKLKVEDTRLDIWTGYSQYLRFIAQMATAQGKTASGRITAKDRLDLIIRFGRSKLSPAAGLIGDLFTGETYLGEDMPPTSRKSIQGQIYSRMMPLAIQDMVDGYLEDSWSGGLVASLGFYGVGVVTYTDEVKRARDKVAQKEFSMSWDEVGTKYGRATQLKLEQTPTIVEAEQEHEKRFAGGTPTSMDNFRNEGKLIEETYRKNIDNAVREFRVTNNGKLFREKITEASGNRRAAYSLRAKKREYQDIIAYYTQPIPPDKLAEMNPGDVVRREFYKQMFDPVKMYDEFGNYRFDEADKIEREFVVKYGQVAMDYIEEYQGARWQDKPAELKMLEEAKELLRPYWGITDKVWAMYPAGLKEISDQIKVMENGTDEQQALTRRELRKYPMILRARELIAQYKKQMRQYNPLINQAYKMYY